jgi:hypothetical protein
MNSKLGDILFYILLFILQIILNDLINLGPYVYLCIFPLIIINLPMEWGAGKSMIAAFIIGLLLDMLSDGVLGLNAAASVLIAAARLPLYKLTINGNTTDQIPTPSIKSAGLGKYINFVSILYALFLIVYVFFDCLGFRPFLFVLLKIVISTAASVLLTVIISFTFLNRN